MTLMEDKHVASGLAIACASRSGAKSQDPAMLKPTRGFRVKLPKVARAAMTQRLFLLPFGLRFPFSGFRLTAFLLEALESHGQETMGVLKEQLIVNPHTPS